MPNKPTVKRIYRVPNEWPTWPFTKLHPEVMRQLLAKLEARKRDHDKHQREYARDRAIQKRRGTSPEPQAASPATEPPECGKATDSESENPHGSR